MLDGLDFRLAIEEAAGLPEADAPVTAETLRAWIRQFPSAAAAARAAGFPGKSGERRFQRYVAGAGKQTRGQIRGIDPSVRRAIAEAARERGVANFLRRMRERGLWVLHFVGRLRVSRDVRRRDISKSAEIAPEWCEPIADAAERDDWSQAAHIFERQWAESYGAPGAEIEDPEVLDLELG